MEEKKCWAHVKTLIDVVREPILILAKNLQVMTANESFYQLFQLEAKDAENKSVYELANGEWEIPSLRRLLGDILPKNIFFKGYEIDHVFPLIGRKVMILNARQIEVEEDGTTSLIMFLAIEDITEMMGVAEMLTHHPKRV